MDVHELEVENAPDGIGGKDPTLGGTSAQMSRDLDSGAGDAFEDGHFAFKDTGTDACANRWYARNVFNQGRTWDWSGSCWKQWHGSSGRGYGFNRGWGRDWYRRRRDFASWPNRYHHWRVPVLEAGTKQPWVWGEHLNVRVHGPGYADFSGRTSEQAVTLYITID